jgi:putative molybdopterin biosynthesis protein
MAAMIASGHTEVSVRKRPVVSIIPTGTELVEPGSDLNKGDILDFNSTMLAATATEYGAHAVRKNIVRMPTCFGNHSGCPADSDIVVINAGHPQAGGFYR